VVFRRIDDLAVEVIRRAKDARAAAMVGAGPIKGHDVGKLVEAADEPELKAVEAEAPTGVTSTAAREEEAPAASGREEGVRRGYMPGIGKLGGRSRGSRGHQDCVSVRLRLVAEPLPVGRRVTAAPQRELPRSAAVIRLATVDGVRVHRSSPPVQSGSVGPSLPPVITA
jgi:hypothetical protein